MLPNNYQVYPYIIHKSCSLPECLSPLPANLGIHSLFVRLTPQIIMGMFRPHWPEMGLMRGEHELDNFGRFPKANLRYTLTAGMIQVVEKCNEDALDIIYILP
jgi:hypothetical protein